MLKFEVATSRSKVKFRSYHDVAHQHPHNKCPYPVSTSYILSFPRYSQERFFPSTANLPIWMQWMKTMPQAFKRVLGQKWSFSIKSSKEETYRRCRICLLIIFPAFSQAGRISSVFFTCMTYIFALEKLNVYIFFHFCHTFFQQD